jgi:hypothetical protein
MEMRFVNLADLSLLEMCSAENIARDSLFWWLIIALLGMYFSEYAFLPRWTDIWNAVLTEQSPPKSQTTECDVLVPYSSKPKKAQKVVYMDIVTYFLPASITEESTPKTP